MKKAFCLFLFFSFYIYLFAQTKPKNEHFTFNGKIVGQQNGYVSLEYTSKEGKLVTDSCISKNGNFYFEGSIKEPTLAILKGDVKSIADDDSNSTSIYLESGSMTAIGQQDHFKEMVVTGSKSEAEYKMLQIKFDSLTKKIASKSIQLNSQLAYSQLAYQFIIGHPASYVGGYLLSLYKSRWPIDTVQFLYNKLSPLIQSSFNGKEIAKTIQKIESVSSGKMSKEFTSTDVNGDSIDLLNYRGKYVLLDFWASWCLPCRQTSSHLINLFKKYHGQGLEIIAIADDDSQPDVWKQAIIKDNVNIWYNILNERKVDKNGTINNFESINDKYGIQVLPTKILIDKNGLIIGRYEGTELGITLENKFKEIFNR
ncbi:MAG: TlpA disulfide reductase family protein [Ferruginibacter sp.]